MCVRALARSLGRPSLQTSAQSKMGIRKKEDGIPTHIDNSQDRPARFNDGGVPRPGEGDEFGFRDWHHVAAREVERPVWQLGPVIVSIAEFGSRAIEAYPGEGEGLSFVEDSGCSGEEARCQKRQGEDHVVGHVVTSPGLQGGPKFRTSTEGQATSRCERTWMGDARDVLYKYASF